MFNDINFCDFQIKLENEPSNFVYCSKYILALKSDYFKTLFSTSLQTDRTDGYGTVPNEFKCVFKILLGRLHSETEPDPKTLDSVDWKEYIISLFKLYDYLMINVSFHTVFPDVGNYFRMTVLDAENLQLHLRYLHFSKGDHCNFDHHTLSRYRQLIRELSYSGLKQIRIKFDDVEYEMYVDILEKIANNQR